MLEHASDLAGEDRVAIHQHVLRTALERERLTQLLAHPCGRGVCGYMHVQYLAPTMLDYEEHIEHSQRERRHREKVHRCKHLAMILEEGLPGCTWWAPRR